MKKLLFSMLLLVFGLCLTGCNKVKYEEDKIKFNEYFFNIDNIEDYKSVDYHLSFNEIGLKKTYKYRCEYKEDGIIEIWHIVSHEDKYNVNKFYNNKLTIKEYDTWPNASSTRVLKENEINISKEEFLDKYETVRKPKYNLDLQQTKYYRTRIHNIDEDYWNHKFVFNKDYVYEIQLFGLDIKLNNCIMIFTTYENENDPNSISYIRITGMFDNVSYEMCLTIDK